MLRSSSSSILWSICQSSREQGALYAACRKYAATASESTEPGGFRFAASAYHGRSLAQGAQYLAQTVREALGPQRPPHLLTLLITPESQWGSSITEVPQVRQGTHWVAHAASQRTMAVLTCCLVRMTSFHHRCCADASASGGYCRTRARPRPCSSVGCCGCVGACVLVCFLSQG